MGSVTAPHPRVFYERPTHEVAFDLLGSVLVTRVDGVETAGVIVETEAYLGKEDPASHAFKRSTGRVLAMSGEGGHSYVYRSYGIHAMLNVTAKPVGETGAVLIRAIEPLSGIESMALRRGTSDLKTMTTGPGKLCIALGITLFDHQVDLTVGDHIWIAPGEPVPAVLVSGRIGVSVGGESLLRFFLLDNRFVSAHRRGAVMHRSELTPPTDIR